MTDLANNRRCELAVIGASWGGMAAVGQLLSGLAESCRLAIAVALHRSPQSSDDALVKSLTRHSKLPIVEADDKMPIEQGRVYVAPADYHLLVEDNHLALSLEAPLRYSRPSIDILFETAADAYADRLVAVLLTGANDDGARGMTAVKKRGGLTFAQVPSSAERAEMPDAAIEAGAVDRVLPIPAIAAALDSLGRVS